MTTALTSSLQDCKEASGRKDGSGIDSSRPACTTTLKDSSEQHSLQPQECSEDNQHLVLGSVSMLANLSLEDDGRALQVQPVLSKALFLMYFCALDYKPQV